MKARCSGAPGSRSAGGDVFHHLWRTVVALVAASSSVGLGAELRAEHLLQIAQNNGSKAGIVRSSNGENNHIEGVKDITAVFKKAEAFEASENYQSAALIWEQIAERVELVLGADEPIMDYILNKLANLYRQLGAHGKAEILYLRALAIREKSLGIDHPDTATILNNLALLYHDQSAYSKAEPLYLRALAIWEKRLTSDHQYTATSLNNLASLFEDQGAYSKAEPLYLRALAIREKGLGRDHPGTATILNNLALLYKYQGAYSKAEPLYLRALAIKEKSRGRNHLATATILNNLADLYHDQGAYSKAKPFYLRALAITEKSLGSDHPDTATSLNNLAVLYQDQGAYSKAQPLYLRALAIQEKSLGSEHPGTATSLINLAILAYLQNKFQVSNAYLRKGVAVKTRFIQRELPYLPINARAAQLRSIGSAHALIFSFPDLAGDTARLALTTRLNRQGLLADIERRQAELAGLPGPQQQLRDALAAVNSQLSSAALPPSQRQTLRARQEQLEQQLYRLLPELKPRTIEIADVASALPAGSALVELQKYQPFDGRKPREHRWGEPRYLALILRPEQSITAVQLGPAAPIETAIQKSLQASSDNTTDANSLWGRVSELVLKPLMPALTGSRQWFLSPDAELNRVPFAVLPAPQEPSKPLAQVIQLRLLTTGRELLRLQQPIKAATAPVVMANPAFERDGRASRSANPLVSNAASQNRSADLAAKVWKPLPGSELEGQQVSAQLGTAPLTGDAASARQLQQLKSPKVLHIASHGFFVGDSDTKPNDPLAMLQDQASLLRRFRGEDPQLRSGLVLAGANQPDADPNDDGYLTAAEAAALKLDGTELVVLSACSTGQGTIRTGEGVYGLQRALAVAGARSTLLSLWKVDDVATAEFMTRFYTRLKAGEGRSDALAATQKEFREGLAGNGHWKDPYYWAAWQLVGDWRPIKGL
jgi:CHAT domain-containing protein/Tfp pilus assembly protein PilF